MKKIILALLLCTTIVQAYENPRPVPLDPRGNYPQWIIERDQEWHRAYDKVWDYHNQWVAKKTTLNMLVTGFAVVLAFYCGYRFGKTPKGARTGS